MPDEIEHAIQQQRDLFVMNMTEAKHKVYGFIDTLSEEQLQGLSMLVHAFATETEEAGYAKFVDGYLAAVAKAKYNICPGCGEDHDKQLDEMRQQEEGQTFTGDRPLSVNEDSTAPLAPYILTEDDLANMEEYNLDDLRDEDPPHHLLGFICKGCGMRYVSIADRMLRPPDTCSGCQMKSAHG